jgi:prepilin-type N-terminal cleavage/methylation domain-containing protein
MSVPRSLSARQTGFTLIELIAAITLLALLATILMSSVRGAERSTAAATSVVERTEQYARTQAFLRDHVGGAMPMRWRREVGQPLKFAGKQNSLTYFAPITSQIAEGGVMWWQLAVAKSGSVAKGSQLVLRRQPVDPEEKAVPDLSGASVESIVLADNIDGLSISYFDPGDDPLTNPDAGVWVDSWDENARMPSLITIRVTEAGDKRWPDLTVPLKLSQALGCNFDYQRQRCVIQGGVLR